MVTLTTLANIDDNRNPNSETLDHHSLISLVMVSKALAFTQALAVLIILINLIVSIAVISPSYLSGFQGKAGNGSGLSIMEQPDNPN